MATTGARTWALPAAGAILVAGWLAAGHGCSSSSDTSEPAAVAQLGLARTTIYWQDITGMNLPISSADGPRHLTATSASSFNDTPTGAAIAAAHLLVRTFAFVGPDSYTPTIARQVIGTDRGQLLRVTQAAYRASATKAGVGTRQPLHVEDGWLVGYHLDSPADGTPRAPSSAVVRVLFRQSDIHGEIFTAFTVNLQWQEGDWRLVAPPWGDWRNAATAVAEPDRTVFHSYDELGTA